MNNKQIIGIKDKLISFLHLNEIQRQAVVDTEGNVLVLAGAGSGKTRVLTYRIAYILEQRLCYPSEILAITFTNKAANEMKSRIENMTENAFDMWVCTIHSMCTRILRNDIERIGYDKNFTIYSDVEKTRLIKSIIKENEYDDDLLKKAVSAIGFAKSNDLSPSGYKDLYGYNRDNVDVSEIYRMYEEKMLFSNALDFDDLLIKTYQLLSTNEDVRAKYSTKFKYIHVDEFQDTNEIQYKIIKLLCSNNGNLFVVGDDDQSIYGFRGAKVKNILNFPNDYENVKTYKLEQNYRSTKKILTIANAIISKNNTRMDKKLWCEKDDGVRVEYKTCGNETFEGEYVAGAIKSLTTYSGYKNKDIAVLYRMNSQSRSIEQELLKYNIPFKVFGGQKFYDRKEIKDLTAYIRAIVNPKDFDAVGRIINVPKRGIGETTLAKLNIIAQNENLYFYELLSKIEERSEFNQGTKSKLIQFRNIYFNLINERSNYSPLNFIEKIILDTDFLSQFSQDTEENQSKLRNVDEFRASIKEFTEQNQGANIADFLQSITLSSSIDDIQEEDTVSLATIHSVKGLEFKVVFIIGLDDGVLPIVRNTTVDEDIEEERRLMYVAVTRAMERLYLTHCETRYAYNTMERSYQKRSRFIDDVEKELGIEKKDDYDIAPSRPIFTGGISSIKAKQEEKNEPKSDYHLGEQVEHKRFGVGIIVKVMGTKEDQRIDVVFKGYGVKTLVVKFAPIKKVEK